ncbi:MAG TPA: Crp/Fnr family transcriptional regulator [Clostridiaceae bacterium]|nr:Crp/Fnr family transcriptional regulator [Clostridiaceae bacterium]
MVKIFKKIDKELAGSPLFHGIEGDELVSLLYCLKPKIRIYQKNEYIKIAGDKFDSIGIVLQGEVTVNKENVAGNRVIMTILKPGDMFGETLVFSRQPYWIATVQAQKKCKVLFIKGESILGECSKLCPWHKTLIQNMLNIVCEKVLVLSRKVEYLSITSIREKICTYLLEQYKKTGKTTFILPMNRKELAEFLNVSRPSLSREMGRLRDEGIIDFHMATVKIIDLERLKK